MTSVEIKCRIKFKEEGKKVWAQYYKDKQPVKELERKLLAENFLEMPDTGNMAVEVKDNEAEDLVIYYYYKLYQDEIGNYVFAMYVYSPTTNSLVSVWAEKIDSEGMGNEYFSYANQTPVKTRDFNQQSFICSLGGTVACTLYGAMLMALPIVSVVAGLGCGAAFAYVCGFA